MEEFCLGSPKDSLTGLDVDLVIQQTLGLDASLEWAFWADQPVDLFVLAEHCECCTEEAKLQEHPWHGGLHQAPTAS